MGFSTLKVIKKIIIIREREKATISKKNFNQKIISSKKDFKLINGKIKFLLYKAVFYFLK